MQGSLKVTTPRNENHKTSLLYSQLEIWCAHHAEPRNQGACRYFYVSFVLRLVCPTTAASTYRNVYDLYFYVSLLLRVNTTTLIGSTSRKSYGVLSIL